MTPIQPGDRVSVELDDGKKYKGTVKRLMPYGNLQLDLRESIDQGPPAWFPIVHPKQVRRLRPKPKRRRVWINIYDGIDDVTHRAVWSSREAAEQAREFGRQCETVEFREVVRKRKGGAG